MSSERLYQLLPMLYDAMRKQLGEKREECGFLRGQPRMLDYVYHHDGCIQREMCDAFSLEASTVSNILAIMEKDGLILRKRNPASSREVNVFITGKGREVQQRLEKVYEWMEAAAFEGFSPEEKDRFLRDFAAVTENMMKSR